MMDETILKLVNMMTEEITVWIKSGQEHRIDDTQSKYALALSAYVEGRINKIQ